MSKLTLAAASVCLSSLVACIPPDIPPPHFRPNPPYAPDPLDPDGQPYGQPPAQEPNPTPPPTPPTPGVGGYPTATRTDNPDQVISPYEPFNVIDISGPPRIMPGKLARDPSNQKIFRVP
ncbi:MAG: hypothetical protein ABI162_01095 [Luteolibacter sp.]